MKIKNNTNFYKKKIKNKKSCIKIIIILIPKMYHKDV